MRSLLTWKRQKLGDLVGPKLPAKDPDTVAKDVHCREAALDDSGPHSDDDRELFASPRVVKFTSKTPPRVEKT